MEAEAAGAHGKAKPKAKSKAKAKGKAQAKASPKPAAKGKAKASPKAKAAALKAKTTKIPGNPKPGKSNAYYKAWEVAWRKAEKEGYDETKIRDHAQRAAQRAVR